MSFEIDLAAVERHRQSYIAEQAAPPSEDESRVLRRAFGEISQPPARRSVA